MTKIGVKSYDFFFALTHPSGGVCSVIVKTAGTFAALDVIDNNFGGQMHYYYNSIMFWQVEHSEWVWGDRAENLQKLLLCSVRLRCPVPGPHSGRRWSKMDIFWKCPHNQNFQIGNISKNFAGWKEMIADANNFGVSFPLDLDVKVRDYSLFMKRIPRAKRF